MASWLSQVRKHLRSGVAGTKWGTGDIVHTALTLSVSSGQTVTNRKSLIACQARAPGWLSQLSACLLNWLRS